MYIKAFKVVHIKLPKKVVPVKTMCYTGVALTLHA